MKAHVEPQKYYLLDANIIIGYYIPESVSHKLAERVRILFESCRKGAHPDWYLLVPNIAIAETFSAFAKYCYGTWNAKVQRNLGGGLDQRRYNTIRSLFHEHLHNGQFLHQVELSRYHVLAIDLIAPIDHNYQHYRGEKRKIPMQAADMLILSMGIHLNHQYGRDRFMIITADSRMADICNKAGAGINRNTASRLGLIEAAEELGYGYSPLIYPHVLNFASATKTELEEAFKQWPLEIPSRSTTGITGP